MCQYCENLVESNFGSSDNLENHEIKLGDEPFLHYQLCMDGYGEECPDLWATLINEFCGEDVFSIRVQIQYCPFCGQKLIRES